MRKTFQLNQEDDYKKSRNYWKYMKGKMVKDGIELVSVTNQFKFEARMGSCGLRMH